MGKLKFLLVNDDGVKAQGLERARKVLKKFGDVFTIAPFEDKSGSSHSVSLKKEIKVEKLEEDVWCVYGTPVDCVLIAMEDLL